MKHQIPDWVVGFINVLPFIAIGGVLVLCYISFKKGRTEESIKAVTPKKVGRNLMLWIVAALVIVFVLNVMQGARH